MGEAARKPEITPDMYEERHAAITILDRRTVIDQPQLLGPLGSVSVRPEHIEAVELDTGIHPRQEMRQQNPALEGVFQYHYGMLATAHISLTSGRQIKALVMCGSAASNAKAEELVEAFVAERWPAMQDLLL